MNHYRITIEPISAKAKENIEAMQFEAAGFILGAEEDLSQRHVTLPDGKRADSRAHIYINGTGVSRVLLHMIDHLPAKLIEDLAVDILRKRAAEADPAVVVIEQNRPVSIDDDFINKLLNGEL